MQASVLEWLEHTAENMPERLALWDEKEQLTFREYRKKSIDVAYGISCALPESKSRKPIVVYMDKNVKVLVSFMGIAYSGNFYSPIDIDMPEQRVNKILDVLEPELVITTKELEPEFLDRDPEFVQSVIVGIDECRKLAVAFHHKTFSHIGHIVEFRLYLLRIDILAGR